jgi:hypothetical protein
VQKINLASSLPAITDAVLLDGTAPTAFPTQAVAVYGTNAGGDCLVLSNHTGSTVRKLVVTDCRAANASAVHISGGGNHVIEGSFLGPDASGEFYLSNQTGILIDGGSTNNIVGGTQAAQRNVISGNALDAVVLDGAGTTGNTIIGNYIGLDAAGTQALTNSQNGITIHAAASGNTVGGPTMGTGNVIAGQHGSCIELDSSGNVVLGNFLGTNAAGIDSLTLSGSAAIYLLGGGNTIGGAAPGAGNLVSGITQGIAIYALSSNNTVQGNRIGTTANGMSGLSNGSGVILIGSGNMVGGTTAGAGNLISGNGNWAIEVQGEANTAQGNVIGVDATGTNPLSNFGGIWIQGNGNTVGGSIVAARNVIDDSQQQGVVLQGSGNVVQGNYIGVGSDGATARGNQGNGIEVHGGAFPDAGGAMGQNVIGGTAAGEANVIANSGGAGVVVDETGATIEGNSIYGNARLGIDLGGDGITGNHACNAVDGGPNDLQNFPLPMLATANATSTDVSGTLPACPNAMFHVEVFASPTADPTGFGQGKTLIGTADVTTDASGTASWMITVPSVLPGGSHISATATNALGETSEFGPDILFGQASDAGAGDSGTDAATRDGGVTDAGSGGPVDAAPPGMDATSGPDTGGAGMDGAADSGGSGASGGAGSSGGCGCLVEGAPLSGGLGGLLSVSALAGVLIARRRRSFRSAYPCWSGDPAKR